MTQKSSCIPADGEVRVGPRTFKLREAWAALDYSHGLLARETRWRWASACGLLPCGRVLGLNLVEGHNDGPVTENALWLDGRLIPVGRTRFGFDSGDPCAPWTLLSEDGRVDLRFEPEGLRREDIDLKLIASRYVQPVGTFHGTVRGLDGQSVSVEGLAGVTEDHRARW
jgi:hypothetical protein